MDAIGWPGRSEVGEEASRAAWMILQHSIGNPEVMRRGLALLQAMPADEVDPAEVAMLEDRIGVNSGLKQRYGTQFDWDDDGQMSPLPIDDPEKVDELRARVGLAPLVDRIRQIRDAVAKEGERPPADITARRGEIDRWRRSVGWS
jgi:hypothetical protein